MQFNKHLLSAHWGGDGVEGEEWQGDGGGKEEIQLEKGFLNWVNFKTGGVWHILSTQTVKTEQNQCQEKA